MGCFGPTSAQFGDLKSSDIEGSANLSLNKEELADNMQMDH
jgi:hypothetical protein